MSTIIVRNMEKTVTYYVIKRFLTYIVTIFVAFTVTFFFLHLIPGNPMGAYIETLKRRYGIESPEMMQVIEAYEEALGLKGDIFTQYKSFWIQLLFNRTLGPSFLSFPTPSEVLIKRALPWSIGLLAVSTVISWVVGLLLGTLTGWKRDTKLDKILFPLALCMSQIPYFFLAVLLVLFFAYVFPIFPSRGAYSPFRSPSLDLNFMLDVIQHSILPSLSLILASVCGWMISQRALVIGILGEDYLLFAQAKGLKGSRIINRYVLRNALLPQITALGMSLGFVVNGAFLVEWIFVYPGIGTLFVQAVNYVDFNTMQGCILLSIFAVLTANLLIDLLYPFMDPRIRYGER